MSEPHNTIAGPYEDAEHNEARPGWNAASIEDVDWALARIAALETEAAALKRLGDLAISRVSLRVTTQTERLKRGVAFFTSKVSEFCALNRPTLLGGGKRKSRTLVNGVIGWKSRGGGLVVTDEKALLAWARNQPVELEFVRVKEEPALALIKAYATVAELIPPGMAATEARDEFYLEAVGAELVPTKDGA